MMTDYTPIDCGLHSEYELAIMQRQPLELCWHSADQTRHRETITPVDLYTRDGEEYMLIRDAAGAELAIRLDRITSCKIA